MGLISFDGFSCIIGQLEYTKKNLQNRQKRIATKVKQANMPKDNNWPNKKKGWNGSKRAQFFATIKGNIEEHSEIWV